MAASKLSRGPNCRGPICHQQIFRGPICRQGAQSAQAQFAGPNLPGPNLPGPNLTGPNLPGPNLPQKIAWGPICRGPICLEPFRITGAKARHKFFWFNNLFLLILLQVLVNSRFQLFIRGGSKKNLVLFENLPTTIPHTPLQPPNPLFGTPLLKQARKLQDAQAEKLTSLQANKLTS